MNFVKTNKEYKELKDEFSKKIDSFLKDYLEFLNFTSPAYWRSSIYTKINNYKEEMKDFTPLTMKHLDNEKVRDEVLSDEDKELWNASKKYNI